MSILSTSSTSTRHFDMNIAAALEDINAAVIVQQLDYWMRKEGVGVIIEGVKYIYNTFVDWVNSQFKWLTVWKFRKAMSLLRSLSIVKVIRYKSRQWNQTNYYSLDRDRLAEFLKEKMAQTIETVEMCVTSPQDVNNQTLEVEKSSNSIYRNKKYTQKSTAEQESDRSVSKSPSIAAATSKLDLEGEKSQTRSNPHSEGLTASVGQNKAKSDSIKRNSNESKSSAQIDYIVNKDWKALIPLLDSTGVPINKTIRDLLKLYSAEKVEGAIAILKARKREKHVSNPSGYFVAALKGDWSGQNVTVEESDSEDVDKGAVFRHWYDLAKQLGYCSGQKVQDGEQLVLLSGSWEKWKSAVERGYSLSYLKKIMKRSSGQ